MCTTPANRPTGHRTSTLFFVLFLRRRGLYVICQVNAVFVSGARFFFCGNILAQKRTACETASRLSPYSGDGLDISSSFFVSKQNVTLPVHDASPP
jgi:hypothetical protein